MQNMEYINFDLVFRYKSQFTFKEHTSLAFQLIRNTIMNGG
jgi:hypothetical protein